MTEALTWAAAGYGFRLESGSRQVIRRAAQVFEPWLSDPVQRPLVRFSVRQDDGGWAVLEDGSVRGTGDSIDRALRWIEIQAVTTLLDQPDRLTVHASLAAESRSRRGVLLLGPSFSGKSTLALALWQAGWSLLSDDVTLLVDSQRLLAQPAPRRVSLRFASHGLFPSALRERLRSQPSFQQTDEAWLFHPPADNGNRTSLECTVAAAVFLAPGNAKSEPVWRPRLRSIDPAAALMAMALCTNHARQDRFGEVLPLLRPWAENVPAFDLDRGPIEDMAAAVAGLFA